MRGVPALLRVAMMNAIQYREGFWVEFVVGAMNVVAILLPLAVIFDQTSVVAGWTWHQSLLVTGFFLLVNAILAGLVEPKFGALDECIRAGQMDYLLLKPCDAQLVSSLQRVEPHKVWDALAGLAVVGWGVWGTGTPEFSAVLACGALLLAGVVAMYSLWVAAICLSFWFVRVDNLRYLLSAVADAGRWPVDVYRGLARVILTVVVPVALATSWPAMALLGRLDLGLAAQGLGVAVGLAMASRLLWLRALRSYTSASS